MIYLLATFYHGGFMARAKTSSFWLTERVQLSSGSVDGSRSQGIIDLGAYVDVGDSQAVSIESIDYVFQCNQATPNSYLRGMVATDACLGVQVTDLNQGTEFTFADDRSLVGSAALNIDAGNNQGNVAADFMPDIYGKENESRIVVNDSLYVVFGVDGGNVGGVDDYVSVRIKCKVVRVSQKDWMAIAIQSTAGDN